MSTRESAGQLCLPPQPPQQSDGNVTGARCSVYLYLAIAIMAAFGVAVLSPIGLFTDESNRRASERERKVARYVYGEGDGLEDVSITWPRFTLWPFPNLLCR
jgi:hypothetical protein